MRATTAPPDLPPATLGPYTDAQLRFARAAWPLRAAQELRSARIFRALAKAARAAMPEPWPSHFEEAVRDEIRHARLCVTVGERMGADKPRYDLRPVQARLAALPDAVSRTASLLLVEVAIGETISTCLFRAGRRAAREHLTRAALGSILGDEARHQRLGWNAFATLWATLEEVGRVRAQKEASRGLAACERQTAQPAMRWLQQRLPFDPAYAALGVLHPEERIEAFYSAVERLVVPRLTRLGLDGDAAWKERYRTVVAP